MSAGCMRWVLSHAVRAARGVPPCTRTPASRFLVDSHRSNAIAASWSRSPFTTAADDTGPTPEPKKNQKTSQDPRAKATLGSVGRKIPHRLIQVVSEVGEDMGSMHRADALKIMDQRGLKLVLLDELKEPPVYRLMSGQQIYQERIKLREKEKPKPVSLQLKELSFSACIAPHDLSTKLKQVESWLEKNNHVRITVRSRQPVGNLDVVLEQMVDQIGVTVGFVSPPKVVRHGKAAMCTLRLPSAKEIALKEKKSAMLADSAPQTKMAAESGTDSTDGSGPPPP